MVVQDISHLSDKTWIFDHSTKVHEQSQKIGLQSFCMQTITTAHVQAELMHPIVDGARRLVVYSVYAKSVRN